MLKIIVSFVIVSLGLPAYSVALSVCSALFGYALFFSALLEVKYPKRRFYLAALWFACVQGVQLFWLVSHPYSYIYALYLFLCAAIGFQFGIFALFITPERVRKWSSLLALAGIYTIFEWVRLFFFSGYSLNPIGLSFTGTLLGLQNASIAGVYGLTFMVLFLNLALVRFYLYNNTIVQGALILALVLTPYLFGYFQVEHHKLGIEQAKKFSHSSLNTLLVQTAFPVEESISFSSLKESIQYVKEEWEEIFKVLQKFIKQKIDLIVLPEYVVPYGTYMAVFPFQEIQKEIVDKFGEKGRVALPMLEEPLAKKVTGSQKEEWYVTNAFICQTIAKLFNADVIVGLQDDQWLNENDRESYSSAFYFWPEGSSGFRYEKRVLLPMAEYIPFNFCKKWAANYGISGSFQCGTEAKVFPGCKVPFGLSICYEETFGSLMLESRMKGSELLVNVTSDIWYPNSKLPKQHMDHAKLRAVEAGIPLVRACNTGMTSAFNSLGQEIISTKENEEWVRQGVFAEVPLYSFDTLYAKTGDFFIIIMSVIFIFYELLIVLFRKFFHFQ